MPLWNVQNMLSLNKRGGWMPFGVLREEQQVPKQQVGKRIPNRLASAHPQWSVWVNMAGFLFICSPAMEHTL